jgi:polyribonucleotide nucleotidyltransferase
MEGTMSINKDIEIGGRQLSVETGKVAGTADGSCTIRYGDTVVLATACRDRKARDGSLGFLPLTCDYLERRCAAGKIPGGFFKREGRPTDKEKLTSRLIDRPIRPLFSKGWNVPVQVIASVLASDMENDGDIPGLLGASLALRMSSIPFEGPIGAVRVGRIGGKFVVNPKIAELEESDFDLVVVGARTGITTIEADCKEVKEEVIVDALKFALPEIQKLIEFQEQIKDGTVFEEPEEDSSDLKDLIASKAGKQIEASFKIKDRVPRSKELYEIKTSLISELEEKYEETAIKNEFDSLQRDIMRRLIIEQKLRIDGRNPDELRPVSCEIAALPRVHGSALFTKGETQALCITTLGTVMDEQKIEDLTGQSFKTFMLHYNFPPFSVGEAGWLRGPGRREIGHGTLAEKALESVLPSTENFPYTIRIVSDILSSNGSSSMATVCAGSLALMDAGIPVKSHVAGVGLGLIDDVVLVDAIGDEDHFGDMDFKLAGTKEGLTAIQLDTKVKGLSIELVEKALNIGREARLKVLEHMDAVISVPKQEISTYAPKLDVIFVPKTKIGQVIGPGGKIIRDITEKTGAKVEISDDGKVVISSDTWDSTKAAKKMVEQIVEEPEIGKTYTGKVKRIMHFGAFVEILPGKEGLIHISQLAHHRVEKPEDIVKEGGEVTCKVIGIDGDGKIQLSRKAVIQRENSA